MKRISDYIIEAVASRRTGKYKELTISDLKPGMRVRIKDSLDGCKIDSYITSGRNTGCPIIGGIVLDKEMQGLLGEVVTVERLNTPKGYKPAVYVEENNCAWPVEIFELP